MKKRRFFILTLALLTAAGMHAQHYAELRVTVFPEIKK